MAAEKELPPAPQPVFQSPEWETRTRPARRSLLGRIVPSTGAAAATAATGQSPTPSRLDKLLPRDRTYLGLSRRALVLFVLAPIAALVLVVLPLAVGLGVGLSRGGGSGAQNLALPSKAGVFTGDLTYYTPATGACGDASSASDAVCAVSHVLFDAASTGSNPNANPLCGRRIRITRDDVETGSGNHSVDVTVVDRCVGCAQTDLDLSLSMFTKLAPKASGRVVGSWAWL